jgi:uncharacterized protein (TIGR02594 family)
MVQLVAFRRLLRLVALVLCSVAFAASITPASARSHDGPGRHVYAHHRARHHVRHHHGYRHFRYHSRHAHRAHGVAQMPAQSLLKKDLAKKGLVDTKGLAETNTGAPLASSPSAIASSSGSSLSNVVAEARRYIGGNPTGRRSLWCARFMNMVLQHSGYHGTGSDMARSFASYGQRVSGPQIGAIAVMSRRGGGHVGVVSGIDSAGNPIVVSGNYRHRVWEAPISRGRIYAYVMPSS